MPFFNILCSYIASFSSYCLLFPKKKAASRAAAEWFHCLFVAIFVTNFLNQIQDFIFRVKSCAFCHPAHLRLQHLYCRNCKIPLCIDLLFRLHNLLLRLIQNCMPLQGPLKRYVKVFFIIHFANFRKFLVNLCQKFCFFLFISA